MVHHNQTALILEQRQAVLDAAYRVHPERFVRQAPKPPSHKPVVWYKGFLYQAASWKTARRVVAKVEFHVGELFPRVGFIVTNLSLPSRAVVRYQGALDGGKRAVGTPLISLGPALVSNSLCSGQEKNTMCGLEVQIGNSG